MIVRLTIKLLINIYHMYSDMINYRVPKVKLIDYALIILLVMPHLILCQTFDFDTANVNNFKVPVKNNGMLGDEWIGNRGGALYDDQVIIWSAGLFLSGLVNDSVWSIGMHPGSTSSDFIAGKVDQSDTDKTLFKVKCKDQPFSESWQDWKDAVELGAKYYDGNQNGVYDPIDGNQNGIWDKNEDRPDLIGDLTIWCVYNDANPKYEEVNPQKIEVKQTVFQFDSTHGNPLNNVLFVRYEIENKNEIYEWFDSVHFGIITDPDIGIEYGKDLVGFDTTLQVGFAYKNEPDDQDGYGDNPPAVISLLLEGPQAYIPNLTFIDENSNGVFDVNETALQTAELKEGPYIGRRMIPGALNLKPTSFFHYFRYGSGFDGPDNSFEMRNILVGGLDEYGNQVDVCTHPWGNGASLQNCSEIDPRFMYSGDPVSGEGWLCIDPADTRMVVCSGPFTLQRNHPITLMYAYVVGRGTDPLNSIEVAREYARVVKDVYDNNFVALPVTVENENNIPNEFALYQNYPNPFNPVTKIKFSITGVGRNGTSSYNTKLIVYDILGREIKKLVNKQMKPGNYEVQFDASQLASGVYFYRLVSGNYSSTKKMNLLK